MTRLLYLNPVLARNKSRKRFFNFLAFFFYFIWNFHARVEYERNSRLKFFSLFLDLYHSVLAINNAGIRFFHFSNFLAIFFVVFLPSPSTDEMRYKNFCSLFLPIGVLAKNNVGKRFFNILIFFFFFLRNFLARVENERNSGLNFFFSFSAYLIQFWLKIMPEWGFLIFWIF